MAAWAQAFATVIAAVVAGFVSYYFLAQQRAKIHEKRLDAYGRLWELTKDFRINGPPIGSERRQQLADGLTKWYFQPGGGMLLTGRTLTMFLKLRANLTCDPAAFTARSHCADGGDSCPDTGACGSGDTAHRNSSGSLSPQTPEPR
jgi:hypothetical protein